MIHWFDIFAVALVFASAVWSWFRGFVREAFTLFSLIGGYVAAVAFHEPLARFLAPYVGNGKYETVLSFAVIFIAVVMTVTVIGVYARRALHLSEAFGRADRVAGAGAGVFKGAVALAIIVYPLALFPGVQKDFTQGSVLAREIIELGDYMAERLTPGLAKEVRGANLRSSSFRKRELSVDKAKKALGRIGENIKANARELKQKIAGNGGADDKEPKEDGGKTGDDITDKDRNALNKLLDKLE